MSKVSLVKSSQSYQGTLKVLEPLKIDLKEKLKNIDRVVIKINFVTTERELATTPFDAVKGFIDFIKPFFKGKIIIAEEASIGNTQKGFERYGFKDLGARDPQVETFDVAEDEAEKEFQDQKLDLTLAAVIGASIVDAINPCAFAVLIILMTTILAAGGGK